MAGKSDTFENDILKLIFNATAISNIADNAGSGALTSLWVALHTSDPGDSGTQGNSEGGYAQYARVAVARTTTGWVVTNNSVSPVAAISFPQETATTTGTFTYASVGVTSGSTASKILYSGALSPTINFGQNVTPSITTGSSITED